MKNKTGITILAMLISIAISAQLPQALNYQAVARNASGAVLQNQHVSIRFSIHDGSPTATVTYQETDTATTNQFGLFTTLVGNGTITTGTFTGIAWATGNKYLEVELDPAGGSNYNDMGTTQLVSVPYALYAQTSGNSPAGPTGPTGSTGLQGIQGETGVTGATGATGSFPSGNAPGEMLYWNGSNWVEVTPGTTGQTLTYCNGVPTWGPCPSLPTVTTDTISSVAYTTATSGGDVTSDGGETVTAYGVCWSTSQNPTITGSHTTDGTGTGTFTSSITGLTDSTTYYVRAYATNGVGTAYGAQISFTTLAFAIPSVTTTAASSVTTTTATSGGDVTSDGGVTVTAYGVCWSTSQNPVVTGSHTTDGAGIGIFTSSITGLTDSTTYYVRAYATNSIGTAYGAQVSFMTQAIAIGSSYQGGIIFYILQPGNTGYNATVTHGLIAAPYGVVEDTMLFWYNHAGSLTTGATGTAIGTGQSNTNLIIAAQGSGSYAANYCKALTLGGYTDWYLPSQSELNELYVNRAVIGGYNGNYYWSSTELSGLQALAQYFVSGTLNPTNKFPITESVRAIRAF